MNDDKFMELMAEIEEEKMAHIIKGAKHFMKNLRAEMDKRDKMMDICFEIEASGKATDEIKCVKCGKKMIRFGAQWSVDRNTLEWTGPYCGKCISL